MLLIKHAEIVGLLTAGEVIEVVKSGLVEQSKGLVQVPPRTTIDSTSDHGWLRLMPGILNGSGVMGFKAMHSTPGVGVAYFVALYDLLTGILLAQLDADWVTSQRTAASAAIAVDELAKQEIECAGLLGSSEQARAILTAVAQVRKLSQVKVFSPTPDNRRKFAEEMGDRLNLTIVPVDRPEQAVKDCDLVLSAYRAGTTPLISGEWIEPGTHICAVSAVRPMARELHDDVWVKSALVAVDDRHHVFESGDGISALASKSITPDQSVDLCELVSKKNPGRTSDDEITLYKAVGTALQDLVLANAIYKRAKERGLGTDTGEFPHVR